MDFDKKDNYSKALLDNFKQFRRNEEFFDFELKSGDTVIKVHRLVLAAASPYFAAMFRARDEEARRGSAIYNNIAPNILATLVDFMYTGKIHIDDTVQELMTAADELHLEDVIDACIEYLKSQLSPFNALNVFKFADRFHLLALGEVARRCALENWSVVTETQEFLDLSLRHLIQLMASDFMAVNCESEVLRAGLRWLNHNPKARAQHCLVVLRNVRLRLVPQDRLQQELNTVEDPSIRNVLTLIGESLESTAPRESGSSWPYDALWPRPPCAANDPSAFR